MRVVVDTNVLLSLEVRGLPRHPENPDTDFAVRMCR